MKNELRLLILLLLGFFTIKNAHAQYDYVSIVGEATPAGWSPNGIQLEQDGNVFTYRGELKTGAFKFHAFYGDYCDGEWINATEDGQALTATDYIITIGCEGPDNKWNVATPGSYSIIIDFDASTIAISELDNYPNLSLVGDATPGGWSLDLASDMQANEINPAIFTWTGYLASGHFKIATIKTFEDGWEWIMPLTQSQDLNLTDYQIILSGSQTDNTWFIEEAHAGEYDITVNLETKEIIIHKSTTTKLPDSKPVPIQVWVDETNGHLKINLGGERESQITIYSSTGEKIHQTKGGGIITINSSFLGKAGVKLVQV